MAIEILFASSSYNRYEANNTLPAKFDRMIDKMELKEKVNGDKN